MALCKAAHLLTTADGAGRLARQLIPYILDAHDQVFAQSPFYRDVEPSPIEALSYNVTSALLSLGINHEKLHGLIAEKLLSYLDQCAYTAEKAAFNQASSTENGDTAETKDALRIATIAMSLLGFFEAAATYTNFWSASERLELIGRVKSMLSEGFLVALETALSTIRNLPAHHGNLKEWKRYVRHYAAIGRPLGAMLLQRSFMWFLVASSSLLIADIDMLRGHDILDLAIASPKSVNFDYLTDRQVDFHSIETIADIAAEEMGLLEDGADYLRLGSTWQQRLAFSVKAGALMSYLNCALLNEDAVDIEALGSWLEDTLTDSVQMADEVLASVVLRSMALLAKVSPGFAPTVTRLLPRFIVQGGPRGQIITLASNCLAFVLQRLSQDAVITTLYTLGNVLSSGTTTSGINSELGMDGSTNPTFYQGKQSTGSSISLAISGEEETSVVHGTVVQAICGIAISCNDPKITALAQSMLLQKLDKVSKSVDARIVTEAAALALSGGPLEFRSLLKLYARLGQEAVAHNNEAMLTALMRGRNHLSSSPIKGSPLFEIYFEHLLDAIISRGDAHRGHNTREADVEIAAHEIAQLLQPLAILLSHNDLMLDHDVEEELLSKVRDAWFNIVVHGFTTSTERGNKHINELRLIASHSKPLVAEQRGEQVESDIELNTVLRRGMSTEHEIIQKKRLSGLLPDRVSEIKGLSYRKIIFLQAAYLVETLRAESGDCTKALTYFLEPSMRKGDMSNIMEAITSLVMDTYLYKTMTGSHPEFSSPYVAKQLVQVLCGCCHRIERVQQAAMACADKIILAVPSALCQKSSLFALCELLSLMWTSCLEAETDEYAWKSTFGSARGGVSVELSDDYTLRRQTLDDLYGKAKVWVSTVINNAPLDVKGLLQTYLSDYVDDGAYGHISLGRSFAMEMGSVIPSTDQRLLAIRQQGHRNINTASDFIAQYTTRQEYRYAEPLPDRDADLLQFAHLRERRESSTSRQDKDDDDAMTALAHLAARTRDRKFTSIGELRDILRKAAASLCRSESDECAIIHHLVGIPFRVFTKESIKLGISLWLGVINENPRMEPRILMEIIQQFESTVQLHLGVFNPKFQ